MVYCSKCGFKNEDDEKVCSKCGAPLQISISEGKRRRRERRMEDECFGLPHGGAIAGMIFGAIIILWGLSMVPGLLPAGFSFWPAVILIIGVLIIAGALYGISRR